MVQSPIIMLVVIRVNMMKLKAKYQFQLNARSYTRKYDEAQSPIIMLVVIRVNMMKLKAKVSWFMQVQL